MRDIKVVVEEIRGFCDLPMRPGDFFTVSGGKLHLPDDGHICLWALGAMLPLLQLKQRDIREENDWVPTTDRISCPDPNGRVIFHIQPQPGVGEGDDDELTSPELPRRLIIDEERCRRCGTCAQACAAPAGRPKRQPRIWVDEPEDAPVVPVACRQCGNAPCIEACPNGALSKDPVTKAVLLDAERCTGCGHCRSQCRFQAIGADDAGRPVICDLCEGAPACVQVCPHGAIIYGFGRELG